MFSLPFRPRQKPDAKQSSRNVIQQKNKTETETKPRRAPDVVIAVMGVTGAGKSSFIASVTGRNDISVGHGLVSETSEAKSFRFTHKGTNFVLIDTPGFDDSRMSNEAVTEKIVQWLESSYRKGTRLNGIIYIHNISKFRMQGSAYQNMRMFRQLCGDDALGNVVLATSFWDQVSPSVGAERERQLTESPEFWANVIKKGAKVVRLRRERASNLRVLEQMVAASGVSLQIQRELVEEKKAFRDTAVGRSAGADKIAEFEKQLEKDKRAEQKKLQAKVKSRQREHKHTMNKLRRKEKRRQWQFRWQQWRLERKHELKLQYDRWQRRQAMHQVKRPLRQMEAEQRHLRHRNERLESEVRLYRY